MSSDFEPYRQWLGIVSDDRPPNHYELLGLRTFESDVQAIEFAFGSQTHKVKPHLNSKHVAEANKLLNEITLARVCLLNARSKAKYDQVLKSKLGVSSSHADSQSQESTTRTVTRPKTKINPQPATRRPVQTELLASDPDPLGLGDSGSTLPAQLSPASKWHHHRKKSSLPLVLGALGCCTLGGLFVVAVVLVMLLGMNSVDLSKQIANKGAPKITKSPLEKDSSSARSDKKIKIPFEPKTKETKDKKKTATIFGKKVNFANPIEEAEAKLAQGDSVDLLALIDLKNHIVRGKAKKQGNTLIFAHGSFNRIQIPLRKIPAKYVITAEVLRLRDDDSVIFGIENEGHACSVVIDGFPDQGHFTGFNMTNRVTINVPRRNGTSRKGKLLVVGRKSLVEITVDGREMDIKVDGRIVSEFRGNPSQLSMRRPMIIPNQPPLFIGTWHTAFQISRLELKPL